MKIITFINEKGGVGKTTLARELGLVLAQLGLKVILIDADGQGDLTRSFGLDREPHFNDFARRPNVKLNTLVTPVPDTVTPYFLHIIRGNEESWGIAGSTSTRILVGTMAQRMRQLAKVYDYAIIDTQPSPDQLHDAISLITDYLIFPTDPEFFSSGEGGGLDNSFQNMAFQREQALAKGYDKAKPLAIVPNKFRRKTDAHQVVLEDLQERYADLVWEPIPLRTAITESHNIKRSLTFDADGLEISKIIWEFANRVLTTTKEDTDV